MFSKIPVILTSEPHLNFLQVECDLDASAPERRRGRAFLPTGKLQEQRTHGHISHPGMIGRDLNSHYLVAPYSRFMMGRADFSPTTSVYPTISLEK